MSRFNATSGHDFFAQMITEQTIEHMHGGENQVPRQSALPKPFMKKIKEKISALVQGWKTEAVQEIPKGGSI